MATGFLPASSPAHAGLVLALALLLGAAPGALSAQTVTGRLVNRETGEPLDAAFVILVDSAGIARSRTLTNAEGRYLLEAPGPGRYSVHAELIGYAGYESPFLVLSEGQTTVHDVAVSFQAIELASIEVTGEQRCTVRPGSGLRTAEVWEEARKALEAAAWTQREGAVRFRAVGFERELDADGKRVLSERRAGRAGYTAGSPYKSLPAEDLAENGYVRPEEDGSWTYYAPDAQVLLSDPFLDTHCFELRTQDSLPELIGLTFRPVERSRQADLRGVLWLDRGSAELRFLEFTYTRLPYPVESSLIGGRVDFDRLGNGPWIVSSWRIRMPEVEMGRQVVGAFRVNEQTYRITGFIEVGADVQDVEDRHGTAVLAHGRGGGAIRGVVYDLDGATGVADAEVSVVGTNRGTRTDGSGQFEVTGMPQGIYALQVTPRGWALPWPPPTRQEVEVQEGDTSLVQVRLPGPREVATALCGEVAEDTLPGVVLGRVTDGAAGSPVAGREVVITWSSFSLSEDPTRMGVQTRWRGTTVTTDQEGWYRACGVPAGVLLRIRAVPLGSLTAEQTSDRLWQPDVRLPPEATELRVGYDNPIGRADLTTGGAEGRRGPSPMTAAEEP